MAKNQNKGNNPLKNQKNNQDVNNKHQKTAKKSENNAVKRDTVEKEVVKPTISDNLNTQQATTPEDAIKNAAGLKTVDNFNNITMETISTAMGFKADERVSPNAIVSFLEVTDRYMSRMDTSSVQYKFTEKVFTTAHAYIGMKLYVQIMQDGGGFNLQAPAEVKDFLVEQFASLGVMIPEKAISTSNDQIEIDFKEVETTKEAVTAAKNEIEIQARVAPSLNPSEWKNEEDLAKALEYIISNDKMVGKNESLSKFIESVREYRKNQETNKEKAAIWDSISAGDLLVDGLSLCKSAILLTGIGATVANYIRVQKTPFAGHCIAKRHLLNYTDADIASVVKAFLIARSTDGTMPFESESITRELILDIAEQNAKAALENLDPVKNVSEYNKLKGRVNSDTVTRGLLYNYYHKELGATLDDPIFPIKQANLMIRIANLYRSPEQKLDEYTESGYPPTPSETESKTDVKGLPSVENSTEETVETIEEKVTETTSK